MICFRDQTWCKRYVSCEGAATCGRALTPEVIQAAREWWGGRGGGFDAPIATAHFTDCYIPLETPDETITSRDGSSVLPTEHP